MSAGFGRRRRIGESAVFRAALANRPRSRGGFFDVHCVVIDTADLEASATQSRLGLIVPKRVCRLAARRNWIKRVVRESFRTEMCRVVALDCVVRLRRALSPSDAATARAELLAHWRRISP